MHVNKLKHCNRGNSSGLDEDIVCLNNKNKQHLLHTHIW